MPISPSQDVNAWAEYRYEYDSGRSSRAYAIETRVHPYRGWYETQGWYDAVQTTSQYTMPGTWMYNVVRQHGRPFACSCKDYNIRTDGGYRDWIACKHILAVIRQQYPG